MPQSKAKLLRVLSLVCRSHRAYRLRVQHAMTVVHRAVYLRQGSASGDIGVSHANLLVSVEGRQMVPASTGEGTWNCAMFCGRDGTLQKEVQQKLACQCESAEKLAMAHWCMEAFRTCHICMIMKSIVTRRSREADQHTTSQGRCRTLLHPGAAAGCRTSTSR